MHTGQRQLSQSRTRRGKGERAPPRPLGTGPKSYVAIRSPPALFPQVIPRPLFYSPSPFFASCHGNCHSFQRRRRRPRTRGGLVVHDGFVVVWPPPPPPPPPRRRGREGQKNFFFSPTDRPPHAKPHFAWRNFYCFPSVSFIFFPFLLLPPSCSAPSISMMGERRCASFVACCICKRQAQKEAQKEKRGMSGCDKVSAYWGRKHVHCPVSSAGKNVYCSNHHSRQCKNAAALQFCSLFSSSKCVCSEPARKWTSARTYYSLSPSKAPTV